MDGLSGGVIFSLFLKSTKWLIFPKRVIFVKQKVGCTSVVGVSNQLPSVESIN